jgi:hypothetical protein
MSNFDLKKYLAEGRLLKEEINFGEYKDIIDFEDLKRLKKNGIYLLNILILLLKDIGI